MPIFTVVSDTDGSFRIHRKGCADIVRRGRAGFRGRAYSPEGAGQHDVEAADADDVIRKEIADLDESFGGDSGYDENYFVVLPCAEVSKA